MLEYGSGSSTFFFASFVDSYVSIEHSPDYCCELERMALQQSDRSVTIYYMQRTSTGFVVDHRFEQTNPSSPSTIEIYCVPRNAPSLAAYRLWATGGRSTYTMYRDYVDFVSTFLSERKFDFVFLDGRARPQVAYTVLKHLNGRDAKVFIHDWNQRKDYHIISREFYQIIDQQVESNQVGGGGLVVLVKKSPSIGEKQIDQIEWTSGPEPDWWI